MASESENYLVHESGMKYFPTYGRGAKTNLKCFGLVLYKPEFRTTPELSERVARLSDVEGREIFTQAGQVIPGFQGITDKTSGEVYSVLGKHYRPIQDREIIQPFIQMAETRGLNTIGRIVQNKGQTRAYCTFVNPETIVRLLEEKADDMMIGVRLVNSHRGDMGWGFKFFGVRMWCCNFNTWGHLLGEFHLRHFVEPEKLTDSFYRGIEEALDRTPILKNMSHILSNTFLAWDEVVDLAWATDASPVIIEQINQNIKSLVPEVVSEKRINAYELWNALTAGATWGSPYNGSSLERKTDGAEKLWYVNHDRLIQKGREARAKYEENLKDSQNSKLVIKVVA